MGPHRARRRRHRMMDPLLVGLLVVGSAFVGIALASQRTPTPVASIDRSPGNPVTKQLESEIHRGGWDDSLRMGMSTEVAASSGGSERVLPKSPPVSLDVDAIGVHTRLHDLGLDATGGIEAPSGARYDEAAWYRHSPMPGSLGPSIILGHVDSASNGPSVFFRLGGLVRGDRISVTRADGSVARFIVQAVASYSKNDFPTERVYGDLDHAGLRLITCGGVFDDASGHYEDNIVVFARLHDPV